jgi:hypothetical protein
LASARMSFQSNWKEELHGVAPPVKAKKKTTTGSHSPTAVTTKKSSKDNSNNTATPKLKLKRNTSGAFRTKTDRPPVDISIETDEETLSRSQASSTPGTEGGGNPSQQETSLEKKDNRHDVHIVNEGQSVTGPVKGASYDEVELMFTISDDDDEENESSEEEENTTPLETPSKSKQQEQHAAQRLDMTDSPTGVDELDALIDSDGDNTLNKDPKLLKKSKSPRSTIDEARKGTPKSTLTRSRSHNNNRPKEAIETEVPLRPANISPNTARSKSAGDKENQSSTHSKSSGLVDSKKREHQQPPSRRSSVMNDIGRAFMQCSPMADEGERKGFSCARPSDVERDGATNEEEDDEDAQTRLFGASITTSVTSMVHRLSQTLNCGVTVAQGGPGEASLLLDPEITKDTNANLSATLPMGPPGQIVAERPDDDESLGDITDYTAEASFAMKAMRGKGGADFMARFAKGANAGANLATMTNPYSGKACGDDEREKRYYTDYDELGHGSLMGGYFQL